MRYVYIFIGGFFGAALRYGIELLCAGALFPVGTLVINLVGCFLLEIIYTYLRRLPQFTPYAISGLGIGFVGAFTTLPAIWAETFGLAAGGHVVLIVIYLAATVVGGLLAAIAGLRFANWLRYHRLRHKHPGSDERLSSASLTRASQGGGPPAA